MSKQMQATFTAESYSTSYDSDTNQPNTHLVDTPITLNTDGKGVWPSALPGDHRVSSLALTPRGWQQVAMHAAALVNEANEAWRRMGAAE